MKKFFSKILIATFVLSFFLAPIQNTNAQTPDVWWYKYTRVGGGNTTVIISPKPYFTTAESCETARKAFEDRKIPTVTVDASCGSGTPPDTTAAQVGNAQIVSTTPNEAEYGCNFESPGSWFTNCIVQAIYTIVFQPFAFLARLAGQILDFFIFYSISSGSYTGDFIEKGWGVVRDIANVLFIIALLYIAIKTVLDLNSSNNKKMVGMIIVMALLINFSLFATKVVIDASNILARVFYSNIKSVGPNGEDLKAKDEDKGEKSITVGLVAQFNPHQIFGTTAKIEDNLGTFATVLFISIIMMGYMIFMFLSVSLLFVSRVIMLWIVMIFSPIAFVSIAVPGIKIPEFGFNEWWKKLSDNAFLAPIFIFFLYLIISFGDVVKVVTGNNVPVTANGASITTGVTPDTFTTYMNIIIPFILIFVLLATAKEVAVSMSGKMGSMLNKAGAMVGGFAVGAATGGAALLGTNLIGGGAKYLGGTAMAEKLRNYGSIRDEQGNVIGAKKGMGAYFARAGLKSIDYGQNATFDARKTGLGKFVSDKTGLNFQSANAIGLGSKDGGLKGSEERSKKNQEKEKELFKTSMTDDQTKEYTLKRREDFLKEKADEAENTLRLNNRGPALTDAEIKRARDTAKNTFMAQAPKVYEKSADLNKERMVMFQDRLGQSDLISSIAHTGMNITGDTVTQDNFQDKGMQASYLKAFKKKKRDKEREEKLKNDEVFDEDAFNAKFEADHAAGTHNVELGKFDIGIAKTMNDEMAKKVKMVIGAGATLATGGAAGALTGSLLAGGTIGAITGGALAGKSYSDSQVVEELKDSMQKEAKNTEKLANRIDELNRTMKKGENFERIEYQAKMNPVTGLIENTQVKTKIDLFANGKLDHEKLTDEIADNKAKTAVVDSKLRNNQNNPIAEKKLQEELKQLIKDSELLGKLKTAEKELFELTGKKPGSGGSSAPAATPPATP